jgi:hypothetical protein
MTFSIARYGEHQKEELERSCFFVFFLLPIYTLTCIKVEVNAKVPSDNYVVVERDFCSKRKSDKIQKCFCRFH